MSHHASMTDEELATAVRESVTSVHMTTPAEEITTRGRTLRTRRRVPLLTGALAGAAAAVLAVTALLPSSGHQASQPVHAKLAAWTVVHEANGDIQVTVRDWSDAAALQDKLRAEGLRVNVSDTVTRLDKLDDPSTPLNASCQQFPGGTIDQLNKVVDPPESGRDEGTVLVIRPSALPDGAGLFIYGPGHTTFTGDDIPPVVVGLAKATPECTGS
jgi:gas vesicle protein